MLAPVRFIKISGHEGGVRKDGGGEATCSIDNILTERGDFRAADYMDSVHADGYHADWVGPPAKCSQCCVMCLGP